MSADSALPDGTVHRMSTAPAVALLASACTMGLAETVTPMQKQSAAPPPPVAAEKPHEVQSPHGTRRDDYYWLRDDTRQDPEMLAYLNAENAYTAAMLAHARPFEDRLYGEILGRIKQDDASVPYRKRGHYYYTRYETGKEYPIYARKAGSLDAPEQVMLEGNLLAGESDFYRIGGLAVTTDNRMLAWAEDRVGRRQYTLRFKNLKTGELLADRIENAESALAWAADGRTLLYVEKHPETLLGYRVRKHALGTDPAGDPLVYEQDDPSLFTSVSLTKDDRFLLIVADGHDTTEVRYATASDPALRFMLMLPKEPGHEYYAEHHAGRWILRTNWRAPNFRIIEVPVGEVRDRKAWQELVAHRDEASIEDLDVFDGFMAVNERSGGLLRIRIRPWDKGAEFFIDADESTFTMHLDVNEELDTQVVRYSYTSLTTPVTTCEHDVATGKRVLLKREPVLGDFDPAQYRTEHLWAAAGDGTQVPVSVAYRKGFARDGTSPLLQRGYGSYGYSSDPQFSVSLLSLLDRGFVFAIAHVRGGREMGRRWYDGGKLLQKKNTFTDFVDVTRFLVREGYADPRRVFATGGSAGGLLMGAVANLAPHDYRGIVTQVPFVDVVTTMLDEGLPLTTNEFVEWGDPRERPYYEYMLSYSPYDNVSPQDYPAMLVTTGLWDSQVQYFEPAKWVAKMRKLKTGDNPLLLRTNMEAGHGGRSGRFQHIREIAEEFAFMLDLAGITD
jgi:oligopeptidase B